MRRIHFDLLAQLPDEHPQMLGMIGGVDAPDGAENRVVREDAIRVARKIRKQLEFLRRQSNLIVLAALFGRVRSAPDAAPIEIDGQIAEREDAAFRRVRIEYPA